MLEIGQIIVYLLIGFIAGSLILRLYGRMSHQMFTVLWGSASLACLAYGLFLGLAWAPPDVDMGDVQRLMYVHFPSWIGTAGGYSTALIASLIYLATRNSTADQWAVAGVEVGLVFNAIGIVTGAIWGKPTWGVWWTWDPRLTATAIMFITFAAYLSLRAFMDEPESRARVSAVVAIVAFINLPIVYFSVRWWRTLHQPQSSPETVDSALVLPLRIMMIAFLLLCGWLVSKRQELARLDHEEENRILEARFAE